MKAISASVPTLGTATCWDVVTDNGRYVYTANSASSSLSGFSIAPSGVLTALSGTVLATLAPGSTDIDLAVSADGKYLYTLNAANGSIGEFAIDTSTGLLTTLAKLRVCRRARA